MAHENGYRFYRIDIPIKKILSERSAEHPGIASHSAVLLTDGDDPQNAVRGQVSRFIMDHRSEHGRGSGHIIGTEAKVVPNDRMEFRSDENETGMTVRILSLDMDYIQDPRIRIEVIDLQETQFLGTESGTDEEGDHGI